MLKPTFLSRLPLSIISGSTPVFLSLDCSRFRDFGKEGGKDHKVGFNMHEEAIEMP